jgi:hypothetical protein
MRSITWTKASRYAVLAGALALGACASTDDVKRAQATADQALQAAQAANSKADAAQSAANEASSKADAAMNKANDVDAKVDRMFARGLRK